MTKLIAIIAALLQIVPATRTISGEVYRIDYPTDTQDAPIVTIVTEDGSRGRITLTLLNSTIDTVRREAQRRKMNFNEYLEKLIAQQMKEEQK